MELWVITFPSVFHSLRAEKILRQQGIPVKLVPIPRELSGSCEGLAAQINESDVSRAVALLSNEGVMMQIRGTKVNTLY